MSEGFKTGDSFCKDQDGNLVTYIKSSLDLWRTHFNAILNADDTNNLANAMIRPSRPNILYNATPVAPPGRIGVAIAKQIASYQCGFRPGKSTIYQIFTLRQILEKTQQKQIDKHHLFVDFNFAKLQ